MKSFPTAYKQPKNVTCKEVQGLLPLYISELNALLAFPG